MKNLLNLGAVATNPKSSGAKKMLLGLIMFCAMSVQGQVSSYTHAWALGGFTAPSTPTTIIPFPWNDEVVGFTFPAGFVFNFNSRNFTSCGVSANGFITFDGLATGSNVTPIAINGTYKNVIAGYSNDLSPTGTTPIEYELTGTAPNRVLAITYSAVAAPSGIVNFQIALNESAPTSAKFGVVELRYRSSTAGSVRVGQMGLRGENNNDFYAMNYTGSAVWSTLNINRGITNAVTVKSGFTTNMSNLTLTFTPPPTCNAPRALSIAPASITSTTATLDWIAPVPNTPSNGYEYLVTPVVSNNMNVPAGTPNTSTAATGAVGAGVLTANLTSLTGSTLYYVYVRSDCGGTKSGWSAPVTFTTKCPAQNIPFFDPFDSPNYANCAAIQTLAGNSWTNVFGGPLVDGFVGNYAKIRAQNVSGVTNNSTYFLNGVNLVAGTRYRLEYKYGSSTVFPTGRQNLKLRYGSAPQVASMTTTLMDHVDFRAGPYIQVINFVVPTTGVYYFGFTDTSSAGNETTYIDNFRIDPSTCIEPNNLIAGGVTNTTASVSWTPGSPNNAANGYNYYVSTSATPPNDATVPTGSTAAGVPLVTISGLTPGTVYYFWVRSNCGSGDVSVWSNSVSFTTTNAPLSSYCIPVSASNASYITNVQSTGAIANINNTSTFSASPYGYQNFTSKEIVQARGGSVTVNTSIAGPTVGSAIWVDWNKNGIFEASERVFNTTTYYTTIPSATFIVPLTAALGTTTMRVMIDYWGTNPNNPCAYSTASTRGESEDYSFTVKTKPTDIMLTASSASICLGGTTAPVFIINPAAYNVYSWSPLGVMGDNSVGYTFAPNSTITYTLTGLNTTNFETTSTTFTVNVNQPPSNITITPVAATRCESDTALTMITAGGGVTAGSIIYAENFNLFTNSFTVENTTTGPPGGGTTSGGVIPQGLFHTEPNGLNTNGEIFNSPDASQFMLSNSDDQGIGTQTHTSLTSAPIDLSTYTTAQLNFAHYYRRYFTDQNVSVEVSTDNFATRTVLRTYNAPQGSSTNWINVNVDLTPYIGNSNVKIRFRFDTVWGWTWAIDNVIVTGSATSSITWAAQVGAGPKLPPTDLYLDAAGTIPYVDGTFASTVYSAAAVTTSYFATATTNSGTGCSTEQGMTVTVTPNNAGIISPGSQIVCSGIPTLSVSGTSPGGNYIWESSPSPFPFVPTVVPGSSNASSLTPLMLGQPIADTYYRVKFTPISGSCGAAYSPTVTVTVPHTTWNGSAWDNGNPDNTKMAVIAGNYSAPGNITACSVVQTAGVSNFPSGITLLVQNQVVKQGPAAVAMVFENSANLVQVNSTIPNSGNINYKRTTSPIRTLDYTYWSSPVFNQNLFTVSPQTLSDKYFSFNPVTNSWINYNSTSPPFAMIEGKGYIIRGPQPDLNPLFSWTVPALYTATFIGKPNNGDINFPITTGAGTMNLIGNPYPSSISANAFIAANAGKMTGALYFWTHNTSPSPYNYSTTDYATYNLTGTLAGANTTGPGVNQFVVPNGNIGAAQGFCIKGTQPGTVQGIFTNAMRGTGYSNSQFFRNGETSTEPTAEVERHRIWLDVSNTTGNFRQTLIGYIEGATDDIDYGYDAEYLGGGNPVEFYSKVADKKVSIKAVGLPFNVSDAHDLVFKTTIAGEYQITASQFDEYFDAYDIFVEDRLMNITHNLKHGAYTFSTEAGTFENRFVIKFAQGLLSTNSKVFDQNNVVVYKKDQKIYINSGNVTMDNVQLFDIRGAKVFEKSSINSNEAVLSPNVAQQVLIVKIRSTEGVEVSKKIVF